MGSQRTGQVHTDLITAIRDRNATVLGLVSRIVEPTTPVSVRYQLTSRGRELIALLHPLVKHAQRWPPSPA